MRPLLLAATLSLLIASLSPSPARAADPSFPPERLRAHVAFLADDLLEGRDTGSRGHEIAARCVASQLEAFGLRPAGDNGGWYQQVGFQRTERTGQRGQVTISGPSGDRQWWHGEDVLVGLNARDSRLRERRRRGLGGIPAGGLPPSQRRPVAADRLGSGGAIRRGELPHHARDGRRRPAATLV